MANGFGSFYIGSSGLQNAQNALNVTANNLTNVDTTGYVRQQVIFADKNYTTIKAGTTATNQQQSGLGVSIGDVVHARDIFLDKAFRQETGRSAFYDACYEVTSQVEDLLQELDGKEMKDSLTDLYASFQELAKTPEDSSVQTLVIQKSEILLTRFQALYGDLQEYQLNINTQIEDQVDRVNEIGARISELNHYIQTVESGGQETAMTSRDERDALIDELAGYAHISTTEDATGLVYVDIEGTEFVTESGYNSIEMTTDRATGFKTPYWKQLSNIAGGQYTPVFDVQNDISTDNNSDIGSIKALLFQRGDTYGTYTDLQSTTAYGKVEDSTLMETQAEIDQLLHQIVTKINDTICPNISNETAINGTDASGNAVSYAAGSVQILDTENCCVGADGQIPPRELFVRLGCQRYETIQGDDGKTYYVYNQEDPTDVSKTYSLNYVSINEDLLQQASNLAGFTQNGASAYAMTEELANLWNQQDLTIDPTDNAPGTFEEYYNKMISKLGTNGNIYSSSSETLQTTASSLDTQRQQVTGVSSDEELSNMVKYQSAYNAASRYINVITQMTDLIVQLI